MMMAFSSQICFPFLPGVDPLTFALSVVLWGFKAYCDHSAGHSAGSDAASKARKPDAFNSGLIAKLKMWDATG